MAYRVLPILALLASAATASADAVIHLVPQEEGPYLPGTAVALDVLVENTDEQAYQLRGVQWDFSQTDATISLGEYVWNVNPPFEGFFSTDLPVVRWTSTAFDDDDPTLLYQLPALGILDMGTLDVTVNGNGWVDAFNSDWDFNTDQGAYLTFGFGEPEDPINYWFSYGRDGNAPELTGGRVFLEVPEPASLLMLAVGATMLLRRR